MSHEASCQAQLTTDTVEIALGGIGNTDVTGESDGVASLQYLSLKIRPDVHITCGETFIRDRWLSGSSKPDKRREASCKKHPGMFHDQEAQDCISVGMGKRDEGETDERWMDERWMKGSRKSESRRHPRTQ